MLFLRSLSLLLFAVTVCFRLGVGRRRDAPTGRSHNIAIAPAALRLSVGAAVVMMRKRA
jgi:hypothetical protein